ncbi:tetratricopeptide repeat protein [Micromonospora sp. WMMD558]|uniref:tetratricopeptide repeat protein n=1 Tax=Micromonospora sp. WMMD558 TaxID=3403462 RepID=UPI003BF53160
MSSTVGSRYVQHVTATAGFAYGVIGADIHVLGDGTPLYVLEDHRSARPPDSVWLLDVPSRMLDARYAVVDFTGRRTELAQLHAWRTDVGRRLAARWLHAPGGQGKTRLADQFAAEARAAGWKTVTATHGPGAAIPQPGSQDLRLDGSAGLLLVVDYADRWPPSHLNWLLSNALLGQPGMATRILLLARIPTCPPALVKTLTDLQAGVSHQCLGPLLAPAGDRARMFTAARDGFAAHYPATDTSGIEPPVRLDHPDLGLTLAVHMAALVAVDAHVHGRRPPDDAAGLTCYLLEREHQHWERLYQHRNHDGHPTNLEYESPPGVMAQAVFTAALTGSVDHPTGKAILTGLDLETHPQRILADHGDCYPPADPTRVLEPLYPDRLAEDYLALTVAGHSAHHRSFPWAAPTAIALLTRDADGAAPAWAPRAITFLASATQRWPHLGTATVHPLLRTDPKLAIDAGSAALIALSDLTHLPLDTLKAIERLLPRDRQFDLEPGAAAITRALLRRTDTATTDLADLADLQDRLSRRLVHAGHYDEALVPAQDAAEAYRRLAEADRAHLPQLAAALDSLSQRLAERSRHHEALAPGREAVDLFRHLADLEPAVFRPLLAACLHNLNMLLGDLGRLEEALTAAQEAVHLVRGLIESDPSTDPKLLAGSLHNLAVHLAKLGRREEALAAGQEAVAIQRRLAQDSPARLPGLATMLNTLGLDLRNLGRHEEALAVAEEAADKYRRLVDINPAVHRPGLAMTSYNLSLHLSALGRDEEALAAAAVAADLYRRVAEADTAVYLPALGASLDRPGRLLSKLGRRQEALAAHQEAVTIHRRLAEVNPTAYQPGLAMALTRAGAELAGVSRRREALESSREAVALYRRIAERHPTAHLPGLPYALYGFAWVRARVGRELRQALSAVREAIALYRPLAEQEPDTFGPELWSAHRTQADVLDKLGRKAEAAQLRHALATAAATVPRTNSGGRARSSAADGPPERNGDAGHRAGLSGGSREK